jgi:hypothetical protein
LAGVLRAPERPHLDGHHGVAAEADRERRHPGADAAPVGDEYRVGRERRELGGILERAPDLLLPLDQEAHADGRPSPHARRAPTWTSTFDFESALPRP